jgi:hypothetical protein
MNATFKWIMALGVLGAAGLIGYYALRTPRRRLLGSTLDEDAPFSIDELFGPNMLATIAKESRSPEEYARRAEAWASAEAAPPSVALIAKAYRGAKPAKVAALVRDAREKRHAQSRDRWKSLIARHATNED